MVKNKEINLFYFRNLLLIASADGIINHYESDFLNHLAKKLFLTDEDYQYILNHIDEIEFIIPDSPEDRIKHFKDLLSMMVVDGEIHPEEYKLILKFGKNFGFDKDIVDETVNNFVHF